MGAVGAASLVTAWHSPTVAPLRQATIVTAFAVAAAFIVEMSRRDGRSGLVNSVSATVSGAVLVVMASGWLASHESTVWQSGRLYVALAAAGVALAAIAFPLGGTNPARGAIIALVVATVAGFGTSLIADRISLASGVALGATAGLSAVAANLLFNRLTTPILLRRDHNRPEIVLNVRMSEVAAAAAPVAIAGMLAFAARLLIG
jgi:hypothetical protein